MLSEQQSERPLGLVQYLEIVQRRRWWILGTFFAVWMGVWAGTWMLPARYRSETTILIDELRVPARNPAEETGSGLQARLRTLTPQIFSRTRLQRIIQDLKLYGGESNRPATEALVSQMRRDIKVEPLQVAGRPDELAAFTVSYSAASPAVAQQVARRLTSLFIEEDVRTRTERAQLTSSFLDAQLQDARAWLQKQETRLQEFKAQYMGQLPSQMQANLAELGAMEGRLQNATEQMQRAQQQKLYLNSLLAQYRALRVAGSSASSDVSTTPPALDAELLRLDRQVRELRLRYTEEHPDLRQLRQQLAGAEKLKAQMQKELAAGGTAAGGESPASAQIQSQLKANEMEIGDRQKEVAGLQAEIRAARVRLRNTPVREQQLAELTRDYEQSRAYYESLLARKNQMQLASSLEQRQRGEQFRILDPPSLPAGPYYPNRFKFSLAGLLLGALAGAAAGYGRELLDDHVHSREQVISLCPAPVLASIPRAATPQDSNLRRLRVGGEIAGASVLLGFMAASTLVAFIARYRD